MTNVYPINPTVGQIITVGGTRKMWDGVKWKNVTHGNHELRLQKLEALTGKVLKCSELGMVSGVGADNSAILNSLNSRDFDVLIVDNYYEFTSPVVLTLVNKAISIIGPGELRGVGTYITIQGSITDLGQLISAGVKGSNYLAIPDTSQLGAGDVIIVHNQNDYSYSPHRPEYHDGEFNVVREVTGGSTLLTLHALKSNYGSLTNIRMYKLNPVTVNVNTKITTTGAALYALAVRYGEAVTFGKRTKIKAINSTSVGALLIDKIYGVDIEGGVYNCDAPANGTQYGINISSCAHVTGKKLVEAHGSRHGIATGSDGTAGGVPCDNVWFYNSKITNTNNGIYSADFHGNTRNSGYVRCEIDNDVGVGGEDITVEGCTIIAKRSNPPIELQEIVGGDIRILNNTVKLGEGFNFNTMVAFSSSSLSQKVSKDCNIIVDGCQFEVNAGVTNLVTILYNQDAGVEGTFTLRGFGVTGDSSGLQHYASLNRAGSGKQPNTVTIVEDRFFLSAPASYVHLAGSFAGTVFTLPSQKCPQIPLTILNGQSESSAGGTGDTGLYAWNFVDYPGVPTVTVNHNGWARAGNPQIFTAVESVSTGSCELFTTTAANSITVDADRTVVINAQVMFEGITL